MQVSADPGRSRRVIAHRALAAEIEVGGARSNGRRPASKVAEGSIRRGRPCAGRAFCGPLGRAGWPSNATVAVSTGVEPRATVTKTSVMSVVD
jgi:hypothetical protein